MKEIINKLIHPTGYDIERASIERYFNGCPEVKNFFRFTPVINLQNPFDDYDVFEFAISLSVKCLMEDDFAMSLFSGNTKNIPYSTEEKSKINALVMDLQQKIK